MDSRKVLDKLEDDLSHYLISEMCKADPTKRASSEIYKYKGLGLKVDSQSKKQEKTVFVRIGVLEAEFKLGSCEKCSGGLSPQEEKLVQRWLGGNENTTKLQAVFSRIKVSKKPAIIPFDLENYYS